MKQWGVNYWEKYVRVINCNILISLLSIASIHKLPSRSTDFLLACTQVDLDFDVFMELPLCMAVDGRIKGGALKINKSLYGLNKASTNWFDLLKTILENRGYHQSQLDRCVFYRKESVILPHVDDFVIISHK